MTHANLIEKIAEAITDEIDRQASDSALMKREGDHFVIDLSALKMSSAALTAVSEAGYVVVPREPTEDMRQAGADWTNYEGIDEKLDDVDRFVATRVYKAMIAQAEKGWKG